MYYKGLFKVKVVTESEGYWIVEALENFDDFQDNKKVSVKIGERKIVEPGKLHSRKVFAPPLLEHAYERKLEKKLKHIIDEYGKNSSSTKTQSKR
jgi:hypothetical protein